jgi:hypothetical protein
MSWDGMTERRNHARAGVRLEVCFEGGETEHPADSPCLQTLNLSAGGFYCDIYRPLEPLTRLALSLVFPPFGPDHQSPRTIDCEAIVVRVDPPAYSKGPYRLAAHFTRLSTEDRRFIDAYVAWHNEVYEEPAADSRSEDVDADAA